MHHLISVSLDDKETQNQYIYRLVQERQNSIANALELRFFLH